jgi:hypothetical protein
MNAKVKALFTILFGIILTVIFLADRHELVEEIEIIKNIKIVQSTPTNEQLYKDLLENTNDVILKYINLPFDYRYGSNSIPLTIAGLLSDGNFLELGLGMYSTPLLHKLAVEKNKQVVSIDTQVDWANRFKFYNLTKSHRIHIMDMEQMCAFGLEKNWGLVLVDHLSGENRYLNMIKFSNISQIVIGHDAEKWFEHYYKYETNKIKSYFKYSCKFSIYDESRITYVSTLILSNFIDVSSFKVIFDKVASDYGHVSCDNNF